MTEPTSKNAPEITLFFSVGIIGMDDNVTEYLTIPLADLADNAVFQKQLAAKAQIAQLKMQVGFLELMTTQFPEWAMKRFEEEGWELPESFLE